MKSTEQEYLDGESLIRRKDYLQDSADSFKAEGGTIGSDDDPLTEDERAELSALAEVYDEIGRDSQLIREDAFEDYARELAEDMGAIKGKGWPLNCIDWERAASELAQDYSQIEFMGHTYYVRD